MRTITVIAAFLLVSAPAFSQTTSGASSSVSISNPASTDTTARVITSPSVVAPGLAAAGVETCLGSATGGLSFMGGGFVVGRTFPDEGCNIRLTARQLFAFGFQKAAMALMCQDTRVAQAMAAVGQACPTIVAEQPSAPAPPRRQKNADAQTADDDLVTGSVETAPERRSAMGNASTISAWRNPDILAKKFRKIIPWKNPDINGSPVAVAAAAAGEMQRAGNDRWFQHADPTY